MLLTTDLFQSELEPISIDATQIDVSEVEEEQDKAFLVTQGMEILRIDAKAKKAKEVVIKKIDQASADAKGKVIYEIQERFKGSGKLLRFWHSLGFWAEQEMTRMGLEKPENHTAITCARVWANGYRYALEMTEKLAGLLTPEELQARVQSIPSTARARIYTGLSTKDRESNYLAVASGHTLDCKEANALTASTSSKLSRAEELLAEARARKKAADERWAAVRADPDIASQVNGVVNPEYLEASADYKYKQASVNTWEKKVAELEAKLEAERQGRTKAEEELDKLKFDDRRIVAERVKRIGTSLAMNLPATVADVDKFFMDFDYYDDVTQSRILHLVTDLANKCGDYLAIAPTKVLTLTNQSAN